MLCRGEITGWKNVKGNRVRYSYRCGMCLACRITKRQEWTFRLMMEQRVSPFTYFATLTYSDEWLPEDNSVSKDEFQRFMKRFRQIRDGGIRYFAVGEYGDRRGRPHYHAVIFSDREIPIYRKEKPRRSSRAPIEYYWHSDDLQRAWYPDSLAELPFLGTAEDCTKVSRYVAGYTVKKLTNEKAIEGVFPGREPEFALMSRKPGIGLHVAKDIARLLKGLEMSPSSAFFGLQKTQDVHMIRWRNKLWPLDRTLRLAILKEFGGDGRSALEKALAEDIRVKYQEPRGVEERIGQAQKAEQKWRASQYARKL